MIGWRGISLLTTPWVKNGSSTVGCPLPPVSARRLHELLRLVLMEREEEHTLRLSLVPRSTLSINGFLTPCNFNKKTPHCIKRVYSARKLLEGIVLRLPWGDIWRKPCTHDRVVSNTQSRGFNVAVGSAVALHVIHTSPCIQLCLITACYTRVPFCKFTMPSYFDTLSVPLLNHFGGFCSRTHLRMSRDSFLTSFRIALVYGGNYHWYTATWVDIRSKFMTPLVFQHQASSI